MPTVPRDADLPAETDDEIFLEAVERLRLAMEAEGENRQRGTEALEFRDGHQWPDDLYNQRKIAKRPSLTINHTNTFCRRVVNNMRQQRPRIKVHPVSDATIDKADIFAGMIRHIEVRSKASVAYDTGGESAVNIGWGYWRILTEYQDERSFDQEVVIKPIRNAFTVYMDPTSTMPAGEDQEWCLITEKMKRSEYKRQYPKADNVEFIKTGQGDNIAQWESKYEIRLAEYYRIHRVTDQLHSLSNGKTCFQSEWTQIKDQAEKVGITVIQSRKSFRRTVEWYRINGRAIVDRRILPGRYIPVIRCEGNVLDLNGEVRRKGMVWDLMDPARMFNYWRTAETEQLALASKAPWVGPAGFMNGHPEWQTANQTPYSALEYEPVFFDGPDGSKTPLPPPSRNPAIEIPAGFVQAAQSAQGDLAAVAGMPHEPGQDSPGSVVSGIALRRREALSDIGHFQYYDNQTHAIDHTGVILVEYIPIYYSTARMQRIIGEDGVPSMVGINQPQAGQDEQGNPITEVKNDLSVGKFDIVMDTGPGYETKRMEGAEAMIDLLKTPLAEPIAKVGADLIVRNMDFAGASDLADRLMPMTPDGLEKSMEGLPKQAKSIVTAMAAHIKQLEGKLQEQANEIKFGITKAHIAATVKAHDVEETNKTRRADTDSRERTQIQVHAMDNAAKLKDTEIKAGAEIIGKHQDAGYESIARKEIEASAANATKE